MNKEIKSFINEFSKEIEEENAAVFAGAGLSMDAGFVNWSDLLKPIAEDIDLDIKRETDLVTLAQYYSNENLGNRHKLNQLIVDEFSQKAVITENHKVLSRLPIDTYWTTNYDKLIEKSLDYEGKIADVKYTVNQLAITKTKRDAVVYKMHGDVDHPDQAVILKDDYESYHLNMQPFITALSGDLVAKTFVFVGLSFTDPNLDYILSRIRSTYSNNQREHYCLLKKVEQYDDETIVDYEYRKKKQDFFINDLKRFNIKVLVLDSHDQITEIFKLIEDNLRRKTVFISGSAAQYNKWINKEPQDFIHMLSRELVKSKFNIISGFGLGVGSFVISGALEEIYMSQNQINDSQLILRPFPQNVQRNQNLGKLWHKYREDMLSRSGIGIFIFGNKIEGGKTMKSDGVIKEFKIAHQKENLIIPVGATGYAAQEIWTNVNERFDEFFPSASKEIKDSFKELNNESLTNKELLEEVLLFLNLVTK